VLKYWRGRKVASVRAQAPYQNKQASEDNMIKKKETWTNEENKLASMLAWMCCHADEDCPSEYRSKHFSSHLDDAVEYLEKSGWYDYNQQGRN